MQYLMKVLSNVDHFFLKRNETQCMFEHFQNKPPAGDRNRAVSMAMTDYSEDVSDVFEDLRRLYMSDNKNTIRDNRCFSAIGKLLCCFIN